MAEIRNTTAAVRANKRQGIYHDVFEEVYLIDYSYKLKCNWVFWVYDSL